MNLDKLLRENIKRLKPYSSAREEYKGRDAIFLDANENPYNTTYNRYPDPLHRDLKEKLALNKNIKPGKIFLGNGSDEAIDLLFRAFCVPGVDNMITINPTYGMYKVSADINDVEVREVLLKDDFQMDVEKMLDTADEKSKLMIICSPNNPTGNTFNEEDIIYLVKKFKGIVVLDEAYIDFSGKDSFTGQLAEYDNLVVLQTFSKAFAMAGIRLGMAFANEDIVSILNKIKYPYNVNAITQEVAIKALGKSRKRDRQVQTILQERQKLQEQLAAFSFVKKVYDSEANFFLAAVEKPNELYHFLVKRKIIVRDRSTLPLLKNCLRFTVGTPRENKKLVLALKEYDKFHNTN
jgi:histidinol-phosphate aminotransferase